MIIFIIEIILYLFKYFVKTLVETHFQITILGKTIMTIRPPELAKCSKMMAVQYLKYNIGNVVVKGIHILPCFGISELNFLKILT